GGGHGDYFGNEMYLYEVDSCRWTRITNPTVLYPGYGPNGDQSEVLIDTASNDTTPQSRHTYSGTCFIQHANRFFMKSRGYNTAFRDSAFKPQNITWVFDPSTRRWEHRYPTTDNGIIPKRTIGDVSLYDSVSRKVYAHGYSDGGGSAGGWYAYDYDSNAWTKCNSFDGFNGAAGCMDTKRRIIVEIHSGRILSFDIKTPTLVMEQWNTLRSGNLLASQCADNCTRGIDYDRENDRYLAWFEGSDSIYVLDPETKIWTTYYAPQTLGATNLGVHSRLRYVPSKKAFMCAAAVDKNVGFFKLEIPRHQDTVTMTSLNIKSSSDSLEQYLKANLTVTATFANGYVDTVTHGCFFRSLDTLFAVMEPEGVVHTLRRGEARIEVRYVTRMNTITDTITIKILPSTAAVDSIRLNSDTLRLLSGREVFNMTGTVYWRQNSLALTRSLDSSIIWNSLDTSTVKVSYGSIQGVKVGGPVPVIATTGNKSDTVYVKVLPNPSFIKRINCQNPSLAVPFGWLKLGYYDTYNATRGYGWSPNSPSDNNKVTTGTNFFTQTRMISYSGTNLRIDMPAGQYIIKAGMGDITRTSGANWLVYGTDTLMKWSHQNGVAGVEIDTITVTGSSLTLRFMGYLCYLVIISNEGININEVAEDGGLHDNISTPNTEIENSTFENERVCLTVSPVPANPQSAIAFEVPKSSRPPSITIMDNYGRIINSYQTLINKGKIIWA
ncbi:MAG: hypothetical protein JNL74_15055, partial [Fibrobacteres bacterium]|nr:hypothetical protein [Fibrobacterota bacterium]